MGWKRKARQNQLTSLFVSEPGCNSGVSGGGGKVENSLANFGIRDD
jgi:hypothetical protein